MTPENPKRKLIEISVEGTGITMPVIVSDEKKVLEPLIDAIGKQSCSVNLVEHTFTFSKPVTTQQKK